MKPKFILLILTLMIGSFTFAQTSSDTSSIETYCEVVATGKLFSNKVSITVDFGASQSFWKDNRIKDETGKVKNFNSVIDALNYMGYLGWKFLNAFPITTSNGSVYHFYFKKNILRSNVDSSQLKIE